MRENKIPTFSVLWKLLLVISIIQVGMGQEEETITMPAYRYAKYEVMTPGYVEFMLSKSSPEVTSGLDDNIEHIFVIHRFDSGIRNRTFSNRWNSYKCKFLVKLGDQIELEYRGSLKIMNLRP